MTIARRSIILTALTLALASSFAHAKAPKDITIGTSARAWLVGSFGKPTVVPSFTSSRVLCFLL